MKSRLIDEKTRDGRKSKQVYCEIQRWENEEAPIRTKIVVKKSMELKEISELG